ncbi:restriction endonuclease subunit S [Jeotgalicoccus nanhaiensis]
MSAQDGLVDQNTYFNKQVASKDMSNYYLLKKGDFAYNKSYSNGFPLGTVKRLDKYDEGTLSSLYIVFRPEKVNSDFLSIYYDTNKWHREVMKLSAEGARNHGLLNIPVNSFFEKKIIIPIHEEEQLEIAKFLKRLEKIITLHQRKINILKTLKKVYLNVMFSNRSEDIPRLHFKSFSEAWEQCEVSNLSQKTFGGGTPKTSKKIYWDGDIPWIQSSDLKEHNVKSIRVNKKITKIGLEHSAAKLIPKNSLAIVTRVGVGKVALIPFEYTTSQDFLSLSNLNVDKYFGLYLMYHNLQKELLALQGTSIKGITKKEVLKKRVRVPKDLQEQVSIGKSLKELDSYINLHQRKLHKLNKIKQVYLNKMFI